MRNLEKRDSIALIGFMGTGKTTVGKLLAKRLNIDYKFVETDDIIEEMAGKSIAEIFKEDGEIKFREYEIATCKKVSQLRNTIVSCGGGVVLNKINIDYIKRKFYIVLLTATPEEILKRIMKEGKEKRPLLNKPDPMGEIKALLRFRSSFYAAHAVITVDTTGKSIDEIVSEILSKTGL